MTKRILPFIFLLIIACLLCSCINEAKVIEENETANKDTIAEAVSAMDGYTMALADGLEWGMTYAQVKKEIDEPYYNDTPQYLSKAFYAKLPSGKEWKKQDGKINADAFAPVDILSFYAIDPTVNLYQYGYMAPNPNLYQYDFLKAYYTDKYGEPVKETWEWNDASYKPTGKEDYYQMFAEGLIKVITVWDIKELDTVLVIDWLNDPKDYNNNFGQISFYDRSDDFDVEAIDQQYAVSE